MDGVTILDLASIDGELSGNEQLEVVKNSSSGRLKTSQIADIAVKAIKTELAVATGEVNGASKVGFDGETVDSVLLNAKALNGKVTLRAYTGRALTVRITDTGIASFYKRDLTDTATPDDDDEVIVDASDRRWKRIVEVVETESRAARDSAQAFAVNAAAAVAQTAILQLKAQQAVVDAGDVAQGRLDAAKSVSASAGKVPQAREDGTLDPSWIPPTPAPVLASDLANASDAAKGATLTGFDGGTVADALVNAKALPNYAALRAYTGRASTVTVVDGFRTGRFRKLATVATGYVDDGGITIIGANGWVWQRINVGNTHVEWFLPQDWVEGVSDDKVAFERASQFLRARGGGTALFFHRHLLDSDTYINDLVHLKGPIPTVGRIVNGVKDYGMREGVLLINPAKTIYTESSAKLSGAILMRKGMGVLPYADNATAVAEVAKFAGTAVTAAAPDLQVENCLFLGFDKAIYSNGQPRLRIKNVMGDCTNGIHINGSFDVLEVSSCHFWPFLTTEWSQATSKRSGAAYHISNSDDWGRLTSCFSFGYERGHLIENADSITCVQCAADWFGEPVNTTMIGFEWTGTSKAGAMIDCQAASQWRAVSINITPTDRPTVQIIGSQFWNNDENDIRVINGYAIIADNFFSRAPISLYVEGTSLGGIVTGNRFDLCGTRPVDGVMTNIAADDNQFIGCADTVMGTRKLVSGGSITNHYDTVYGNTPISTLFRRAGGTSAVPTALPDGQIIASLLGQAHNGTDFRTLAGIRFQTSGAQTTSSAPGAIVFSNTPVNTTAGVDNWVMDQDRSFRPIGDGVQNIARAANRVNNLYLAVAATVGSDARYKTEPDAIPDLVLDAWALVDFQRYKLLDSVALKGDSARYHVGVIAQRVVEAFAQVGLDARDYALLCHDAWDAKPAVEGVLDEEGNVLIPASPAIEADDRYSIRYEEALVLETALMRRTTQRLEARLAALESK